MHHKSVPRTVASAPLVEVTRGAIVESLHRGFIAAVDADGEIIARLGEIETRTWYRSAAKPFQSNDRTSRNGRRHEQTVGHRPDASGARADHFESRRGGRAVARRETQCAVSEGPRHRHQDRRRRHPTRPRPGGPRNAATTRSARRRRACHARRICARNSLQPSQGSASHGSDSRRAASGAMRMQSTDNPSRVFHSRQTASILAEKSFR